MQEFIYAPKQLLPFVSVERLYRENELCLLPFLAANGSLTSGCALPDCLLPNPTPLGPSKQPWASFHCKPSTAPSVGDTGVAGNLLEMTVTNVPARNSKAIDSLKLAVTASIF